MRKRVRYIIYIILFISTISINAVGGVFALFNVNINSAVGVDYEYIEEKTSATLVSGSEFVKKIASEIESSMAPGGVELITPYTTIVFDYATEENLTNVESATRCESVAEDGSDDILLYEVGDAIYVLSNLEIYANEDCYGMFDVVNADMDGNYFDYTNYVECIVLNNFNTSNVTNMSSMFGYCSYLTQLDLSNFDTSNVTNMCDMFNSCGQLVDLNLSNFNTLNVTDMGYMFAYCNSLETIYVSSLWTTESLNLEEWGGDFIFGGCYNLVGGNGTVFDENYTDQTYARIDTPSTPGYLTLKTA